MRRIITRTLASLVLTAGALAVGVGCSENQGGAPTGPSATPQQTAAVASAAPSAAPTVAAVTPPPTAAEMASGAPSAGASGAPSATPAASGAPVAGAKTFECGAKGQKLCPMQAWMKGAMASASSSGDAVKLASALSYAAGKPPPGYGQWASISSAGAAKAKAGDIDGAKATCKQCHDLYKEKYKSSMRDNPW